MTTDKYGWRKPRTPFTDPFPPMITRQRRRAEARRHMKIKRSLAKRYVRSQRQLARRARKQAA